MAYTPYGPWTDGGAPGVSAEFLNPLETFLQSVNSAATDSNISAASGIMTVLGMVNNVAAVTITGTTGGSASLYQFLRGNVKACILYLNNYQNNSATEQVISLPQAYTAKAFIFTGNLGGGMQLRPYTGGTAPISQVRVTTSLAATGGNALVQNTIYANSIGRFTSGFDAIGLGTSETATTADIVFIVGI